MGTAVETSQLELLVQIASLYSEAVCTDLDLVCADHVLKVHRAILCARSPVLRRALTGNWRETCENKFVMGCRIDDDLAQQDASDDPIAVKMMVEYMYAADYDPGVDPYGRATRSSSSDRAFLEPSDEKQLAPCTLTPDNHDDNSASSAAIEVDDTESEQSVTGGDSNCTMDMSNGALTLHAKVYSLGDKYDMPSLQTLALQKFRADADTLAWVDDDFCSAVSTTFELTAPSDCGLRPLVVRILHEHNNCGGKVSSSITNQICQLPELAYSLWKYGRDLAVGPSCAACHAVTVVKCPGRGTDFTEWHGSTSCGRFVATCECLDSTPLCDQCSNAYASSPTKNTRETRRQARRL